MPRVQSGQIVALRLVDIAYGIDLKWAERLWRERARKRSARPQLSATPLKAMSFLGVPPLALQLDPVKFGAQLETADASVRLYDFGIAAFALRVPVGDVDWQDFTALLNSVDAAIAPDAGSPVWRALLDAVRAAVGEALERPSTSTLEEDYLIGLVHELDQPMPAEALLERIDLAPMLAGDRRPLSEGARRDLLRNRFSYYVDDLVVLAWDRAFIYEPRRDTDVIETCWKSPMPSYLECDTTTNCSTKNCRACTTWLRRRAARSACWRPAVMHGLPGGCMAWSRRSPN